MKKIFLLPYAGATSSVYYKWKILLEKQFVPYPVELAGRGSRSYSPFYRDCGEAADDISNIIKCNIDDGDEYCIFGHSMGALLAFETYYKLEGKKIKLPYHIFFSGKEAPDLNYLHDKIHHLSDDKFLDMVSLYGALPDAFYSEEIKKIFLPVLRNDFRIISEYSYIRKNDKIKCNISILYGDNDFSVKASDLLHWKNHAGRGFQMYSFAGGHFFIHDAYQSIIKMIEEAF